MHYLIGKVVLVVAIIAPAVVPVASQRPPAQKPSFEGLSIKPTKSDGMLAVPPVMMGSRAPQTAGQPGLSLFTAIQELGLKLEAGTAPLEVVVIDSVQKPSAN